MIFGACCQVTQSAGDWGGTVKPDACSCVGGWEGGSCSNSKCQISHDIFLGQGWGEWMQLLVWVHLMYFINDIYGVPSVVPEGLYLASVHPLQKPYVTPPILTQFCLLSLFVCGWATGGLSLLILTNLAFSSSRRCSCFCILSSLVPSPVTSYPRALHQMQVDCDYI